MKLTKITTCIAALICLFTFNLNILALPGDLDTTFDVDGKVYTSIGIHDYAQDVAIQPDGKFVLVGYSAPDFSNTNFDLSLARLNTDGTLDVTFGTGGKVILAEAGVQGANSVVLLPDGKILAVGFDASRLAAFRFNSNGTVDNTFGANGRVIHAIGFDSAGNDVVLQPDGKIVIAGYSKFDEFWRFTVLRLNADGSLDTSFNSTGYNAIVSSFGARWANGVALQTDGKIVAGGIDTGANTHGYWGRFGTDGILEGGASNFFEIEVRINDVAIQPDGKIVFAGFVPPGPGSGGRRLAITRFNSDKTLDIHFGNGGVGTAVNFATFSEATSIFIQPSGRIVVGGPVYVPNIEHFGVARFNAHGFLDLGFGTGGKVLTQFGGDAELNGLAQQADGKIVAVGHGHNGTDFDFAAARYDASNSNTMPTRAQFDFDGDGRSDVSVVRPSTATWYIFNSEDSTVTVRTFGNPGDIPIPADYDADARTDFGVYQPSSSSWWWNSSVTGFTQAHTNHVQGDFPRNGDFTGDGRADIIIYQNAGGSWNRRDITGTSASNVSFGAAGDKPVLGDFDGDTKVDPAIYRPSTGEWWYAASSAGGAHRAARWGISTDIPAPADFDGDFKTDFAVYRPSEGVWYIFNSSNGSYTILNFGLAEDKPVPADYDGDGKADIAVFRPSTGVWYVMRSTAGFMAMQFGVSTDIPIPNAFIP